jgi:hypothetical protein
MVPTSSLTAAADEISPLAQKEPPFTPTTTVDAVVATAGGTTTICPAKAAPPVKKNYLPTK